MIDFPLNGLKIQICESIIPLVVNITFAHALILYFYLLWVLEGRRRWPNWFHIFISYLVGRSFTICALELLERYSFLEVALVPLNDSWINSLTLLAYLGPEILAFLNGLFFELIPQLFQTILFNLSMAHECIFKLDVWISMVPHLIFGVYSGFKTCFFKQFLFCFDLVL